MDTVLTVILTHIVLVGSSSIIHQLGHLITGLVQGMQYNKFFVNILTGEGCCSLIRARKPSQLERVLLEVSGSLCSIVYILAILWNFQGNSQASLLGLTRLTEQCFNIIQSEILVDNEEWPEGYKERTQYSTSAASLPMYIFSFVYLLV